MENFKSSINNVISAASEDINDTEANFSRVYDGINAVMSLLGDGYDLSQSDFSQRLSEVATKFFPMQFTACDRNLSLEYNVSNQNIDLYQYGDEKVLVGTMFKSSATAPFYSFNDVGCSFSDGEPMMMREVVRSLQTGLVNCQVLQLAIQSADIKAEGTGVISWFQSKLSSLGIKLDDVSENTQNTINDILDCFKQGDKKGAIASYITNIYNNLNTLSSDSDGIFSLNSTNYYVEGFFGTAAIKAIISAGATVVSTILTVIKPVIGIIAYAITSAFNKISEIVADLTSTTVQTNQAATDNVFAQKLFRLEHISVSSAQLSAICGTYSVYNYDTSQVERYPLILQNGICQIRFPGMLILMILEQYDALTDSIVTLEIYPATDFCPSWAEAANSFVNQGDKWSSEWRQYGGSTLLAGPVLQGASFTSGHGIIGSNSFQGMIGLSTRGVANMSCKIIHTDFGARASLFLSLATFFVLMLNGAAYSTSKTYVTRWSFDYSNSMSMDDVTMWFVAISTTNLVTEVNQHLTWEHLVNHIIPSIGKLLSATPSALFNFLTQTDNLSILHPTITTSGAALPVNVMSTFPTEDVILFTPPRMSIGAYVSIGLALTAAVVVTTAAAIAAFKIRRTIQKKQLKKLTSIEAAKYRYEATLNGGSAAEQSAAWEDYTNQVRKYNRTAWFYSSNSYGWASGELRSGNASRSSIGGSDPTASRLEVITNAFADASASSDATILGSVTNGTAEVIKLIK